MSSTSGSSVWREPSGVVNVFEAGAPSVPNLRTYFREVWERRAFIDALAKSEQRERRSGTFLGPLWAVADPLAQACIYFLLFSTIRSGSVRGTAEQLPLLVFCIFVFTTTTARAFSDGGNSISKGKGLMMNSTFPRMVLPITTIYKGVLNLGPALALYVLFHVVFGKPISVALFMIPLFLLLHVIFNTGLALTMSTLNVFVKDLSNLQGYLTRLMLFTSPIIYPADIIPEAYRNILIFQPLFSFFASYRDILSGSTPDPLYLFMAIVWSLVFIVLGVKLFISHERDFALLI